jgi:PadR family transcriptional regulator PadR
MSTKDPSERAALLQGTLDLLILRTLYRGPVHGHGIAMEIERTSGNVLLVDHGSLYPALQRLEDRGAIRAAWGVSDNGRRARFYDLTARGKKQLQAEAGWWRMMTAAVDQVLGPAFQKE